MTSVEDGEPADIGSPIVVHRHQLCREERLEGETMSSDCKPERIEIWYYDDI